MSPVLFTEKTREEGNEETGRRGDDEEEIHRIEYVSTRVYNGGFNVGFMRYNIRDHTHIHATAPHCSTCYNTHAHDRVNILA